MGAAISGLLLHIGDRLGLYKAMAGAGPITSADAGRSAPAPPSGTSASGSPTRPPAATSPTTRPTAPTSCPPSRPWWSPTRTARSSWAAPSRPSRPATPTTTGSSDAFRTGAGVGWHEHDDRLFSGVAAALPPRLRRPPGAASGCPRWTGWSTSCGPGRAWPTSAAGSARPRSSWRRPSSGRPSSASTSTSRRSRRAQGRGRGRGDPADQVRGRVRPGAPRHRLRPGVPVRLPARHGRPGRGGPAHPAGAGTGRHAAAGRADRRRRARGEPEPGRADLLRPVHGDLHARVAGPGGRPRARRAGRRAAAGRPCCARRASAACAGPPQTPFNLILEARP